MWSGKRLLQTCPLLRHALTDRPCSMTLLAVYGALSIAMFAVKPIKTAATVALAQICLDKLPQCCTRYAAELTAFSMFMGVVGTLYTAALLAR